MLVQGKETNSQFVVEVATLCNCGRLLVILLPMCTVEGNMCAHLISVTIFKLYITPFSRVIGLQHGDQIQVRDCRPSNRGKARPSLKY
jgi:hypothetical protein